MFRLDSVLLILFSTMWTFGKKVAQAEVIAYNTTVNVIDKASHWQLAWSLLVDMEQHHLAPSIVTRCTTMTSYRSTNTVNGWQGALNILTKTHEEATEVTAFFGLQRKAGFLLCFRYFCGLISVCVCVGVIVLWLLNFTFAAFVCSWFVPNCLDVPKQNRISLEGLSTWLGPKHLEKIRSPVTISGKNVRQDWLDDYQIVSSNSKCLFDGKLYEQWKKKTWLLRVLTGLYYYQLCGDYFIHHYK